MRYYDDSVQRFDIISKLWLPWTPRTTRSLDLSASQILGRRSILLLGAGMTRQTGSLSGNRNTVDLSGTRISETLPEARDKFISTLRYVHCLSEYLAFHFDYRFYDDDWDIRSHTWQPSLAIALDDEETKLLRVLYRQYTQTAAEYYAGSFSSQRRFMTSDSDLSAFQAKEIGIQYSKSWETETAFQNIKLGTSLVYYWRTNDLRALLLQAGITAQF